VLKFTSKGDSCIVKYKYIIKKKKNIAIVVSLINILPVKLIIYLI